MGESNGEHRALAQSIDTLRDTLVDFRTESRERLVRIERNQDLANQDARISNGQLAALDERVRGVKRRVSGMERVLGASGVTQISAVWSTIRIVAVVLAAAVTSAWAVYTALR